MRRYRFDPDASWPVSDHGSSFSLSRLLWVRAGEVRVDVAYLKADDRIGEHEAGLPQLFCVVGGSGWVSGAPTGTEPVGVQAGDAVFWAAGEQHSAGTETGMKAIIIQAETLDPDATLHPADRASAIDL